MDWITKINHYAIPEPTLDFSKIKSPVILAHMTLSPESTAFLNKMIVGFKWVEGDYHEIEWFENTPVSFSVLFNKPTTRLIWSFGIKPSDLGIFADIPKYQMISLHKNWVYFTDSLDKIDGNTQLKKRVWTDVNSLKLM